MLLVFRAITIQEVYDPPPYIHFPGLESDLVHCDVDMTNCRLTVFVQHWLDRQVLWV
jgi:hypothetical protein